MTSENLASMQRWIIIWILAFMAGVALSGCDDTDSHDTTNIITVCEVCWPPGHCMRDDHPQFDEWWDALSDGERSQAEWLDCVDYELLDRPPRIVEFTIPESE